MQVWPEEEESCQILTALRERRSTYELVEIGKIDTQKIDLLQISQHCSAVQCSEYVQQSYPNGSRIWNCARSHGSGGVVWLQDAEEEQCTIDWFAICCILSQGRASPVPAQPSLTVSAFFLAPFSPAPIREDLPAPNTVNVALC